ncbi:MAG: hypothetical protein AAB870_02880 [Patescibacteria group bacterium]
MTNDTKKALEQKGRLKDAVLLFNQEIVKEYSKEGAAQERRNYRVLHPTEIITHECMDGRSYFEDIVQMMKGILYPFRNIGGKFDLSWLYFQTMVLRLVDYAINLGRNIVAIITYHYSEVVPLRGCKGFDFDKEEAISAAMRLQAQYLRVFGSVVLPIVWGIETDTDALVLHGSRGERVKVDPKIFLTTEDVYSLLTQLYPTASKTVIADLVPLIEGNLRHQKDVIPQGKICSELDHTEEIIAIGWRLDALAQRNKVLTIGPFDPYTLENAIATAAQLVVSNIKDGRIPGDEVLLMTSFPFWDETGPERYAAEESAQGFIEKGLSVVKKYSPQLIPILKPLVLRTNMNTKYASVIDFKP